MAPYAYRQYLYIILVFMYCIMNTLQGVFIYSSILSLYALSRIAS